MRQKDVNRIAGILEREMMFAHESEVEGLRQAIGAIRADVGWAQPELDMSMMDVAMDTPTLREYGLLTPCYICGEHDDHRGRPHGEITGDGRMRVDVEADESHIVRGAD